MTNREQILRSTSALFLERGCKSLTMDEVASANGMSKRTLYELFHDKAKLLQECILLLHKDNMVRSEEELSKAGNVLEWFMNSLRNKDSQRMTFYYDFFTEVKKYYPEVFLNVVKDVNRGVLDAHSLSLQLFELSVAVTDRAVRNYLEIKHDRGSDCLMLFLIRGIASEKGRAYIDGYLENNKSMLE